MYIASRSGQSIGLLADSSETGHGKTRLTWRIDYFSDTLLTTSLAKKDSGGRSMRQDVATDGLATIDTCEESACSWIGLYLVGL